MGFWNKLMYTKAEDWTYLELGPDQVPTDLGREAITADEAYLTVTLRSLRIVDVRRALTRFYGAVHSWSSVSHIDQGRAEFQVVTTPAELKDVDAKRLDRVISMERPLLGPVPYRGGGLELELGLFSIVSQDLAGPFLDVLESLSNAAGVTYVTVARPFIEPLTAGIRLLTGTQGDALLEIGLSKAWDPTTGYYVIVRAPRGEIVREQVRIAADQRLTDLDGRSIQSYPYVVFSIEATRERPNWFEIPDLKRAYDELNSEVRKGKREDSKEAFAVFRRTALTSPDLLYEDARVIVEKVDARLREVLGASQTARGRAVALPALEKFSPFV